jgi:hypothetical protein
MNSRPRCQDSAVRKSHFPFNDLEVSFGDDL